MNANNHQVRLNLHGDHPSVTIDGTVYNVDTKQMKLIPTQPGHSAILLENVPARHWPEVYRVMYPGEATLPALQVA